MWCFLRYESIKGNFVKFKNTFKFSNNNINKFILFLRKKTEGKLGSLTDIDLLLMVAKGIRGVIYHSVHRYAKVISRYMKDYDKNRESSYLKFWDVNNLHGWTMSQNLPVNKFEWIEIVALSMNIS